MVDVRTPVGVFKVLSVVNNWVTSSPTSNRPRDGGDVEMYIYKVVRLRGVRVSSNTRAVARRGKQYPFG